MAGSETALLSGNVVSGPSQARTAQAGRPRSSSPELVRRHAGPSEISGEIRRMRKDDRKESQSEGRDRRARRQRWETVRERTQKD